MASSLLGRLNSKGLGARLVKTASASFFINITGAVLAFALQLFLARILKTAGYGTYTYVITWVNFLTLAAVLGLDTASLKFIPQYLAKKKDDLAYGFIVWSKRVIVASSAFIILVVIGGLQLNKQQIPQDLYRIFIIGLPLLPIHALIRVYGTILQGLHHLLISQTFQVIVRPILVAAIIISVDFYLKTDEALTEAAMLSNVLSGIIVIICLSIYLKKCLKRAQVKRVARFNSRIWIKTALPLLLNSGFHVALAQGDILLIGYFLDVEQVGLYAAAYKTASLVIFILTAVNSVAAPMISQFYGEDNKVKLQHTATISARVTFIFSLPICLVLIFFNQNIITIFGHEYINGGNVLAILAGAQLITALTGSVGYILILTGKQNIAVAILAGAAISNLVLNIILIPKYGIIGAAIATVVSTLLWNVLMYISTYRLVGIDSTIVGYNKFEKK